MFRRFKDIDVASTLAKSLPESCTLYVISKGKVQNIRPTGNPIPHHQKNNQPQNDEATPTRSIRDIFTLLQNAQLINRNKFLADSLDYEDVNRYGTKQVTNMF